MPTWRTHSELGPRTMVFGMKLIMDLDGCDADVMEDPHALTHFAEGMVDVLGMKAYGEPILQHFGHADPNTAGYTLVQLIETSDITCHFSPHLERAHVDIFSCRAFSSQDAMRYAERFFRATEVTYTLVIR